MKPLAPRDLGQPGRRLWGRIITRFEVLGCEDLLAELCRIADRLAEVRQMLKSEGIAPKGKKHPLADLEPKLSAQFQKLWKMLGLADSGDHRRLPGRPSNYERED